MEFDDFDIEVENSNESDPEHFNGSIVTAGTPISIIPTNTRPIRCAFINVNTTRDPDTPNNIKDAIKVSIDGGTTFITLMSGESQYIPGVFTELQLDSNENGTNYQVIVWS